MRGTWPLDEPPRVWAEWSPEVAALVVSAWRRLIVGWLHIVTVECGCAYSRQVTQVWAVGGAAATMGVRTSPAFQNAKS